MANFDNTLTILDSRPTRSDAVKNRELLLETASTLFADKGVDNVSMTEIAQEARVGKGTLYRHFNNKAELCHALLDHDMQSLQNATLERLGKREAPCQLLRWFLAEVVRFVTRNEALLFEASETGDFITLEFPAHLWWRQTIQGLLNQLMLDGDLDYLSDVFYVLIDVNTIYFQRHFLHYDVDRIIDGLFHTVDRLVESN